MRKKYLWFLLNSTFILFYNFCFYLIKGYDHPLSIWVPYIFVHLSYIILIISPKLVRKTKASSDYGRPIVFISYIYFYISYYTGVAIFFIYITNIKIVLLIYLFLTTVFLLMMLSNLIANEYTADSIDRHENEKLFIKDNLFVIKNMLYTISDKNLYKKVESIYDKIHASPLRSSVSVASLEYQISRKINVLKKSLDESDFESVAKASDDILSLIDKRNNSLM